MNQHCAPLPANPTPEQRMEYLLCRLNALRYEILEVSVTLKNTGMEEEAKALRLFYKELVLMHVKNDWKIPPSAKSFPLGSSNGLLSANSTEQ